MKNIILVLLANHFFSVVNLVLSGQPHCHTLKCLDNSNSKIKMSVFCTTHKKYFQVCGVEKNDAVYIRSKNVRNPKKYYLTEKSDNDTGRSFESITSNYVFHRKILNDTVSLRIIKQDSTVLEYKFLIIKDSIFKK